MWFIHCLTGVKAESNSGCVCLCHVSERIWTTVQLYPSVTAQCFLPLLWNLSQTVEMWKHAAPLVLVKCFSVFVCVRVFSSERLMPVSTLVICIFCTAVGTLRAGVELEQSTSFRYHTVVYLFIQVLKTETTWSWVLVPVLMYCIAGAAHSHTASRGLKAVWKLAH